MDTPHESDMWPLAYPYKLEPAAEGAGPTDKDAILCEPF